MRSPWQRHRAPCQRHRQFQDQHAGTWVYVLGSPLTCNGFLGGFQSRCSYMLVLSGFRDHSFVSVANENSQACKFTCVDASSQTWQSIASCDWVDAGKAVDCNQLLDKEYGALDTARKAWLWPLNRPIAPSIVAGGTPSGRSPDQPIGASPPSTLHAQFGGLDSEWESGDRFWVQIRSRLDVVRRSLIGVGIMLRLERKTEIGLAMHSMLARGQVLPSSAPVWLHGIHRGLQDLKSQGEIGPGVLQDSSYICVQYPCESPGTQTRRLFLPVGPPQTALQSPLRPPFSLL